MLRKYDYSESSQILRLFTREEGALSTLARGTKKKKSSFGGALDVFYLGQATVLRRPRSGLDLLTAFRVETAHPGLRRQLERFYAAWHLVELLVGMTREGEPYRRLFDFLATGLHHLEGAAPARVPPLLICLELGLLKELGFAPNLSHCVSCEREVKIDRNTALSVRLGGTLCANCREEDPRRQPVRPGALAALRRLAEASPSRALRIHLASADLMQMRNYLDRFEEWRLERPLRTSRFL